MFVELVKEYFGHKPGAVVDLEDGVAKALVTSGIAKESSGALEGVITDSLKSMMTNLTTSLNKQIDEVLKGFAAEATKSYKNAVPAIFGQGGEGDPKKTFGQFLLAVRTGDTKALEEMGSRWADWDVAKKATDLNTQSGTAGGYTVPEAFLPNLLALSEEMSVVLPKATKIPIAAQSVKIPYLDVVTAPTAGNTAFFGGVKAFWAEEAATLTQTDTAFKSIELMAHELSGYTVASNTLLADSAIGLEALLRSLFARAIAWYKDYAFFRGTGAGQPLGILNATALISVTRSGASAFALADAAGMLGRLLPGWSPKSTVWAIHPTVLTKLLQLTDGTNVIFIDNARAKPTMTLFGIDIAVTEKLPSLNTLGDVLLLDLQHYLVGERQQVEIAYSEHVKFLTNQGTWRFVARTDGQPWLRDKITLADASSTLSPFVGLAAG